MADTKTFQHAGDTYELERDSTVGSQWQLYRRGRCGREWLARSEYQNDLRNAVTQERFSSAMPKATASS